MGFQQHTHRPFQLLQELKTHEISSPAIKKTIKKKTDSREMSGTKKQEVLGDLNSVPPLHLSMRGEQIPRGGHSVWVALKGYKASPPPHSILQSHFLHLDTFKMFSLNITHIQKSAHILSVHTEPIRATSARLRNRTFPGCRGPPSCPLT